MKMPRPKTLKALVLDAIVFVGMFALLGHLSINFWERFVIQAELSSMKTSLHSLKDTINKIGFAYDNLHRELVGLAIIAENKPPKDLKHHPETPPRKKRNYLDRSLHDIKVQAIAKAKNHTTLTSPIRHDKTVQNLIQEIKTDKTTQNCIKEKKKCYTAKNMSTATRYPAKSTGVGESYERFYTECPNEEYCKYRSCTNSHRCCKEYECCNPSDNWKF